MIGQFDSILRRDAPFRRYSSFAQAGIDINSLTYSQDEVKRLMLEYQEKFTRILLPSFKKPALARSEHGQLVNLDEALEGIAECFRVRRNIAAAPFRIGINISAKHSSTGIYAIRGAAVLTLVNLMRARNQRTEIEIAYGNGRDCEKHIQCHVRMSLTNPSIEMLTRITCSSRTLETFGMKLVRPITGTWRGFYRFKQFPWKEYDFVLDRIETANERVEYERVLTQLKQIGATK